MNPAPTASASSAASLAHPHAREFVLSGNWTALGIGAIGRQIDALGAGVPGSVRVDATRVEAMDTVGAWMIRRLLQRLREAGAEPEVIGSDSRHEALHALVAQHRLATVQASPRPTLLETVGRAAVRNAEQIHALLGFVGQCALALGACLAHPARMRWRPVLYNIDLAGTRALPIVGVLAFLLGVVVAYQGAEQLRRYGANIFVADLVGWSMLREFAPLITAIIVAGRSGSAWAAQIGTMAVTEEIDALRTMGIAPVEILVLPKILALVLALPLLTVFADLLGVFGGMVMARAHLDVGFAEFLERFEAAIALSTYVVGVGKAVVFALIIAVIGTFQGFRTRGGADSVGRQTTRSVVQAIFLVIVADALFSVAFSMLGI